MTTRELQDWHIKRVDKQERIESPWSCGDERFPATVDGAASAMPPGWDWWKSSVEWLAQTAYSPFVKVRDTGDEIHDRYLLAKIAWQELAASK